MSIEFKLVSVNQSLLSLVLALSVLATGLLALPRLSSANIDGEKLGKLFIKAATTEVNGQQFPDATLEESVKDIKKRAGKFVVVDNESEADFLIIVVERKATAVSGEPASKTIVATLSVRDGSAWKPATKLQSGVKNIFWQTSAEDIIKQAEKWIKANVKK